MAHDILATLPLFAHLPEPVLIELGSLLRPCHVQASETVFWLGQAGEELYVVQTGMLMALCPDETGKEVQLGLLAPGDFFGEISLLDGGPRTATVRAQQESILLSLGRADFLKFLVNHPDAAVHMLTVLGRRQRETLDKVRGIRNANDAIVENATGWDLMAQRIARVIASRSFVMFNLIAFVLWILTNIALSRFSAAGLTPFDKAPAFSTLSFIVTAEALFISLFVLISQGMQGDRDRIRADLEYQVNLKAHQEVMQLQQKVDRLTGLMANKK